MKKFAKQFVARILWWQVRRLQRKNKFITIAVAGSVGKTSTKFALASVLRQQFKVRFQEGNYNDIVSVPLIFFDRTLPSLFNPLAWLKTILRNEADIRRAYTPEVVIIEVGTDRPGDINMFVKSFRAQFGVLTAIAPEHMELFGTLDAVASEELALANMCDQVLVNKDMCATEYMAKLDNPMTYALNKEASYRVANISQSDGIFKFDILKQGSKLAYIEHQLVAKTQLYGVAAAAALADILGVNKEIITRGVKAIRPVSGRMNRLRGKLNSIILDDTYNASPEAVKAALSTLYALESPQRIAILGNMNELGDISREAHQDIGELCDPNKLAWVVTVGKAANEQLAGAAAAKGCKVKTFNNPYDAGSFVAQELQPGAVILAKGSQNGVFAEEAIKSLLAYPEDEKLLVRQSADWMAVKAKQFKKD